MSKIKLIIEIGMPAAASAPSESDDKCPPEAEVRKMLEKVNSGHDSEVEWKALKSLYAALRGKKDDKSINIMKMIEPTLNKNGFYSKSSSK